jgi:hypothetical protein
LDVLDAIGCNDIINSFYFYHNKKKMSRDNDPIKSAIQAALLKDRRYWNPEQDRKDKEIFLKSLNDPNPYGNNQYGPLMTRNTSLAPGGNYDRSTPSFTTHSSNSGKDEREEIRKKLAAKRASMKLTESAEDRQRRVDRVAANTEYTEPHLFNGNKPLVERSWSYRAKKSARKSKKSVRKSKKSARK